MKLKHTRRYDTLFATDVLRAIRTYKMIEQGDRVYVGLSGGKDSSTLLYILTYLNKFSPLHFHLSVIHIKNFTAYDTAPLKEFCDQLKVPYHEHQLLLVKEKVKTKGSRGALCGVCANLRKGAMARLCCRSASTPAGHASVKLALGHHATDYAENFFMNMFQTKKLEGMSPVLPYDNYPLTLIRPMIYLAEETIIKVHQHFKLPKIEFVCPYASCNSRHEWKKVLSVIEKNFNIETPERFVVDTLEKLYR